MGEQWTAEALLAVVQGYRPACVLIATAGGRVAWSPRVLVVWQPPCPLALRGSSCARRHGSDGRSLRRARRIGVAAEHPAGGKSRYGIARGEVSRPAPIGEGHQTRGATRSGVSYRGWFTSPLNGGPPASQLAAVPAPWGCRTWGVTGHPAVPRHGSQGSSHEEHVHAYEDSSQHLRHRPRARSVGFGSRSGPCRALCRVPRPRSPFRKSCRRTRSAVAGEVDDVRQCRDPGPHGRHGACAPTPSH